MSELNSGQRKYLRSLAHSLEPTVIVGKQGVSDMLVRAVSQELDAHELIKVRFNEFKEKKKELSAEIVRRTGASLAGIIGHVAMIYRPHDEPEKRRIVLPE